MIEALFLPETREIGSAVAIVLVASSRRTSSCSIAKVARFSFCRRIIGDNLKQQKGHFTRKKGQCPLSLPTPTASSIRQLEQHLGRQSEAENAPFPDFFKKEWRASRHSWAI